MALSAYVTPELLVFAGFSVWYLGEPVKWNHVAAFVLIVAAAVLLFLD